ncbi:MAG: sugar ABC transporter permease [Spirochaetales bacterium]|nr:sugar ABC transporter permease [Spirochaetales bacterium]
MLKKKTVGSVIGEICQHIVLIFIAFIVLVPIIEVVFAGLRKNQAVYGPHFGLIPIIDTNTWTDTKESDRRANIVKKNVLIARFTNAVDGMSKLEIMDREVTGKLKATLKSDNDKAQELKNTFIKMVKGNGKNELVDRFKVAFDTWKFDPATNSEVVDTVENMFFSEDEKGEMEMRFVYDVRFTFDNYKVFFTGIGVPDSPTAKFPMLKWFLNSIIVSLSVAIIQLVIVALAGYAFSRFNFKGKKIGLMTILTIQVFPGTMAMVALYLLLLYLGKIHPIFGLNSLVGLVLIYLGGGIPFNIWMVKGYFDSVPKALEESAMIDGATPWQAFTTIILPLVRPILAVVTILQFVGQYNEYVLASVMLTSQENYTLAVGLQAFVAGQGAMNTRFGIFSAAAFIGSLPIVVLWLSLQNQIISGLTGGSVKG